ncbi:MAG: succinate dehydrogenase, cytochrome b556 subunit [Pseudomonadales bacterium]
MANNDSRPVDIQFGKFSWPVTAIASISHRISAVIIWVGLGIVLATLYFVSQSEESFDQVFIVLKTYFLAQFVVWGLLSAFGYYCMGTIKHLIQDMGYCEEFASGKIISWVAIILGLALSVLAGVYVWA